MNTNKQVLNRTGQIGLVVLVASMTAAVFSGGSMAFVALLSGILGFYLLSHQEFSFRAFFMVGGKR
jgi:hypothetical protein